MTNKTEVDNIAMPILKQILQEAQNEWLDPDSKYKEYRNLQIDKRGSFGERFFAQTLTQIYFRRLKIEYNDRDYDGVLFLRVAPNQLYIKFALKADIPFDKLHNREERKTSRGCKWDFKEKDMIKILSFDDIKQEFEKHFSKIITLK